MHKANSGLRIVGKIGRSYTKYGTEGCRGHRGLPTPIWNAKRKIERCDKRMVFAERFYRDRYIEEISRKPEG